MYHFLSSGLGGIDILTVKTKACKSGALPKGIIIPIGYFHVYPELRTFGSEYKLHTAMVRHIPEDSNAVYALATPNHYVNRFGIFFTRENLFENSSEDWDIPDGCLARKNVQDMDALIQYI